MSTTAQRSFSGGEISPSLYARTDTIKFASGLRSCRNHLIMRHGGSTNRPGTTLVREVKDSTKKVRLIEFVFNDSQTCVLEFGDLYIRIHQQGATVLVTSPAAWSNATTYTTGDLVSKSGVNYYSVQPANLNHSPPNASWWYPQTTTSGSSSIFELPTTYAQADLATLQVAQSGDVVTIVHPNYAPAQLLRMGATNWILIPILFGSRVPAPTYPVTPLTGGSVGTFYSFYRVTAVSATSVDESEQTTLVFINAVGSAGAPIILTWNAVAGAGSYNIYKATGPSGAQTAFGLVGTSLGTSFADTGFSPDYAIYPPEVRQPFGGAGDYPSAAAYYQQRLLLGGTNNNPQTVWTSKTGLLNNFDISSSDASAVTFTALGRKVSQIRHLLDLNRLILFTSGSELSATGDSGGSLTPTAINLRQQSYNGSSTLRPIVIGGEALYVQERGSIVRNLSYVFQKDRYDGEDLTIYASHLVDGYTLVDWAFAQIPNAIVWAVRSDGVLLGLTYVPEQQIMAWHRHDTDGFVENVCVVPENLEDAVYLVVRRTINGVTKRYVERMASRHITNILDAAFMDCSLSYDGRNLAMTTMTLSGGTLWNYTELLTLTASAGTFVSGDVGTAVFIDLLNSDGSLNERIRFTIAGYTSATVVTGYPNKDVPVGLHAIAVTSWTKAIKQVTGLSHLEGKTVSVFADGFVVGSPNNSACTLYTVTGGSVTLDKPYGVIHVGLPYISDLQTLDIDTIQGETLVDKKKRVDKVTIHVEKTRGLFVGAEPPDDDTVDPLQDLMEFKVRNSENFDDPVAPKTGTEEIIIQSEWNSNGRVFIRQVDPLPCSILSVFPAGNMPFTGG